MLTDNRPALLRSLPAVVLAVLLALVMVITTPPQRAHAFSVEQIVRDVPIVGDAVWGPVESVGQLGSDAMDKIGSVLGNVWDLAGDFRLPMPWESGNPLFDADGAEVPSSAPGTFRVSSNLRASNIRMDTASGYQRAVVTYTHLKQTTTTIRPMLSAELVCRDKNSGVTNSIVRPALQAGAVQDNAGYETYNFVVYCGSTTMDVVSAVVRPVSEAEWNASDLPGRSFSTTFYSAPQWLEIADSGYLSSGGMQYKTEVTCQDSNGGTQVISVTAPAAGGQVVIPSCKDAGYGSGTGVKVVGVDAAGNQVGTALMDIKQSAPPQTLQVRVDGNLCTVGDAKCVDWARRAAEGTGTVECLWGGAVVGLSQCNQLEGAYRVGGTPWLTENTDGNHTTWTDPATVEGWVPHEQTTEGVRPVEGYVPGQSTYPSPVLETAPDLSNESGFWNAVTGLLQKILKVLQDTFAFLGSVLMNVLNRILSVLESVLSTLGGLLNSVLSVLNNLLSTVSGFFGDFFLKLEELLGSLFPSFSGIYAAGDTCMAGAWSWNPLDWVFTPVKCALSWAFVPDASLLQAHAEGISGDLSSKGVAPLINEYRSAVESIPGGGGGCMGPPLTVDMGWVHDTYYLFNACDDMAPIAQKANVFIGFLVSIAGGLACLRFLSAGFGFEFRTRATTSEV